MVRPNLGAAIAAYARLRLGGRRTHALSNVFGVHFMSQLLNGLQSGSDGFHARFGLILRLVGTGKQLVDIPRALVLTRARRSGWLFAIHWECLRWLF